MNGNLIRKFDQENESLAFERESNIYTAMGRDGNWEFAKKSFLQTGSALTEMVN